MYTTRERSKRFISALIMTLMFFLMIAPISQQNLPVDCGFLTAVRADPTDGSGGNGSTGIGNIDIGTDGSVSFSGQNSQDATVTGVISRGKTIVGYILGICLIVSLGFLILNITKFAKSGDNEQERRRAVSGIATTVLGIALLGAASFIYAFAYGLLQF